MFYSSAGLERSRSRIEIVFTNENHGHFPKRGQVQGFMETPLVGRAVAKETRHHLILAGHLGRQSQSNGDRDARTDNGIRAHHSFVKSRQVLRAALALATARLPAIQL